MRNCILSLLSFIAYVYISLFIDQYIDGEAFNHTPILMNPTYLLLPHHQYR